jgi:hypothetical protein
MSHIMTLQLQKCKSVCESDFLKQHICLPLSWFGHATPQVTSQNLTSSSSLGTGIYFPQEPQTGIEPVTCRLQGGCSGHLSYWGVLHNLAYPTSQYAGSGYDRTDVTS